MMTAPTAEQALRFAARALLSSGSTMQEAVDLWESILVDEAIVATLKPNGNHNLSAAARLLAVHRNTLYRFTKGKP